MRFAVPISLMLLVACGGGRERREVVMVQAAAPGMAAPATTAGPVTTAPGGERNSGQASEPAADRDNRPDPSDLPSLDDAADPQLRGKDDDKDEPLRTVAGLGDPARGGLWMETPLVRVKGPGRVVVHGTARAAPVTLIPMGGPQTGRSRLSAEAMRVLHAPLDGLVDLDVYPG